MTAAIVMPIAPFDPERLPQPLESVFLHLARRNESTAQCFATPALIPLCQGLLGSSTPVAPLTFDGLADHAEVYFIHLGVAPQLKAFRFASGCRIYMVDESGGIHSLNRALSEFDDPELNAHVFNRLGPRDAESASAFFHFPFGYLYRDVSWGPINAFGHRHEHDLRTLADRPRTHKVILGYGGSAAWGWGCLPHQVWTGVLEQILNARMNEMGGDLSFSVINLAGPGHVIIHEMITHMLHAHRVNPDLVITLDGTNDLWNGQMCDPFLVAHDVVYQEEQEQWAQILHQSSDRPRAYAGGGDIKRGINQPGVNIRAYVARVRQFRAMIEASGAKFIWALQPMLFSKSGLHRLETGIPTKWTNADKEIRVNMPLLFELLNRELPMHDRDVFVNIHEAFKPLESDAFCFWDIVHPSPGGHKRIAEILAARIEESLLPKWMNA
ncbi:MAG: hypothetical protein A3G18_02570 [Rhodospirillales bacterium RIFCSPLOWO2_12_FULL_58_28]|nr:MAG: hypothetical protein A3H92_06670 [Rhodospirillales bacterium RIFCSPLOWO2_02_FULL_58_16]OHC78935.1 MAG: hypothetical protein A3G18_02570 [Rhodospirillales bacterium RIFCSPLOWO2_12_FULL_58_28]